MLSNVTDLVLSPKGLLAGVGAIAGFGVAGIAGAGLGFFAVLGVSELKYQLGY